MSEQPTLAPIVELYKASASESLAKLFRNI